MLTQSSTARLAAPSCWTPFLGSGTTVIAAERTGRRCCGLELDPAYVDTIVRRWQALTGGSAHHAASGGNFDDLAREAEATNAT